MIERILELMKEKGVTASELTSSIEINNSAISEWKKGKSKPGTEAIIKIAQYFEISTDYLLTGNDAVESDTKKELTRRDQLVQEIHNIIKTVPDDKLEKFKALLQTAIDATK